MLLVFDTSKVTSMTYLFQAVGFVTIDLFTGNPEDSNFNQEIGKLGYF